MISCTLKAPRNDTFARAIYEFENEEEDDSATCR
jgi:hypothetical protein